MMGEQNQMNSTNPTRSVFTLSPTTFPCDLHFSRSITDTGKGGKYSSYGDRVTEIKTKSGETFDVSYLIEKPETAACHGLHLKHYEKKTNGWHTSEATTQITIQSNAALPFSVIKLKDEHDGTWSGSKVIVHYHLSQEGDLMETEEPYRGRS